MNKQLELFFNALTFYTRLPGPSWVTYSSARLFQSNGYLPLMGWIVAAISVLVYLLAGLLFAAPLAILMALVAGILVTGAFHEDGFADVCDGFGGGYNKEQILTIMKDSRVGSYGLVGLILLLLTKFISLTEVSSVLIALFVGHGISRLFTLFFINSLEYVRDSESKTGDMTQKLTSEQLITAGLFGLLPLLLLPLEQILAVLLVVSSAWFLLKFYFYKHLGGYTGDCLGASQQIFEVLVYLVLGAQVWSAI